jgi:MFS family permease
MALWPRARPIGGVRRAPVDRWSPNRRTWRPQSEYRLRVSLSGRNVLQIGEVRFLVGARIAGGLGGSALVTIVGFQVYEATQSALALGGLGLVEAIPALGLSLFGGHLADRRDRRSIVLLTTAFTVLAALALAFIARPDSGLGLPAILAVIFASGVAGGLLQPATSAFEAQVIPIEFAASGASWLSSVSLVGGILGPVLGGFATAVFGLSATYLVIAVLFGIEVGCIALIAKKPRPIATPNESLRESLSVGIRYVRGSQAMLGAMALDLFAVLFGGAVALLPIFATDVLHVGPAGLGVLRTAPSVGALLVMLVATRRPPMRRAGPSLLIAVAGFGLSILVFAVSTNFYLSIAALFMTGVTDGVSVIIRSVIMRVLSPERLRGRIASVNWIFIGASNQLGAFESGVAASILGTVPSVVAGGFVTLLVVGLVALRAPGLRRLDLAHQIAIGGAADPLGPAASVESAV